ncbi:hypothetical protein J6590_099945 [Homalodisca vitripennis]|nr:hypothetical protein J6590_099945 [Homalodisca vitripennis]
MFSEINLVKLWDFNPLCFPKLIGKKKISKWNKFLIGAIEIICFITVVVLLISYNVTGILTFVVKLSYTYFLVSIAMNTYSIFSIDEMDTVGLEDLTNVDLALENTMSSQTDFFYVLIFWVMMIHMFSILRFALKLNILHVLNRYITICSAFQSVLMKHMVSKRMNCIQVKAQDSDNVLKLLATTRSILGFNQKIDDIFSVRTANVVAHGLLMFFLSLTSFWSIYGTHKKYYSIENHSPVFAILMQGHIITELFCLGGKISKISTCVSIRLMI